MSTGGTGETLVAIVGGGLAGLAAAAALSTRGCRVELFEARKQLGGRAASFRDPASGETVDHCQHVGMGCCTSLLDFCRRLDVIDCFRRDEVLTFIGPDGRERPFRAARWLPAPLHLAPSFGRMRYLTARERFGIARALWALVRHPVADDASTSVGQWLVRQGQSQRACTRFWSVVLKSALGEDLDRASLSAARKVFVDGFMAARDAYVVYVPRVPLATIYDRVRARLIDQGVSVQLGQAVERAHWDGQPVLTDAAGRQHRPDFVVLAVPWTRLEGLVDESITVRWPWFDDVARLESSPITGVHLWFDRPIMPLPHAVLVGRVSQWVFARPDSHNGPSREHYYQVIISASRDLAERDRDDVVRTVHAELASIWPQAREADLLRARVVHQPSAVFSVTPESTRMRPPQQTEFTNVLVAGDWTATGWPATMEGAVRSGYLAAEAILRSLGRPQRIVAPPLEREWLARLLIRD